MFNTLFHRILPYLGSTLLIIFSVSVACADAQNTDQPLSLNRAISLTLASNPQLHQFSIKKQRLMGLRAYSDLSPALNIGIEVENVGGGGDHSGIDAAETTIALSSVIELGGKRGARVSAADARLKVLEYQRQAFTLDILGELALVFVKTLELQELLKLAAEARDLAQNTLRIVENRSRQGAAPESEAKRAAAALAQAQLQLDALQRHHQRNQIKLASYWGETSPVWQQVAGDLYVFGKQPNFSELYQRALASPSIEVFASELRLKTAELQLAKTQSRSDISWQVGVRRFEQTEGSAFTVGMSVPLFSSKRNRGSITTAMAERDELEYQRQSALLRLHTQLFDAFSQREQHLSATHVYQSTIIPRLTSALASTQQAYETGRYSYRDWMTAQQELLSAKQALVESSASAALNQAVIEQLVAEPLNR